MKFQHLILQAIMMASVMSCAFVPVESKSQKYKEYKDICKLESKKRALSVQEIEGKLCSHSSDANTCLMIWGVVVPVSSFVISGSVVLVGNILHWLEYQGTCKKAEKAKTTRL